jgi:hypothetical protein
MDYDAYDALLHHVFKQVRSSPPHNHNHLPIYSHPQTQGDAWFRPTEENISSGVCLRVQPGQFRVFPYGNESLAPFEAAIRILNPVVAVKVRSAAVHAALNAVTDDALALYVDPNTRIQIIDSIEDLPRAEKEQCGAFIVRPPPPIFLALDSYRRVARRTCARSMGRRPRQYHPPCTRL